MDKTCVASIVAVVRLTMGVSVAAQETYLRAEIEQNQLRLITSGGRQIVPEQETDQVGFDKVAVSPDRRAVGWLVLFPNSATSCPIPLKLIVYVDGRQLTFTGADLPVWRWMFSADSRQVAFQQETVHGGFGVHYELRDLSDGRLVAAYDPVPDAPGEPPPWVQRLDAAPR